MKVCLGIAAITLASALSACGGKVAAAGGPAASGPEVQVATVESRTIHQADEFSGRFRAVDRVEVRPRVSGYISSSPFIEGQRVRKGDLLFVIDPRPYQAELDRSEAQLAHARDQLALANSQKDRAQRLLQQNAISREQYDVEVSAAAQSGADVQAAAAAVAMARLNLEFTRITAPMDGIVGRRQVTPGNLVSAGQTLLTTLVSVDPIYVEFDTDEASYLRLGEPTSGALHGEAVQIPVLIGLANEDGYPHQGVLSFVNNELNGDTGTILLRGRIANPNDYFRPGMFARVRLVSTRQYTASLVRDDAVGTDQNDRFVFVLGNHDTLDYRRVVLGSIVNGMRVIQKGLQPGETIVVDGLQRVQPGEVVQPVRVPMFDDVATRSPSDGN